MPELRVEPVAADQWRAYRDIRLAMLLDSPRAYAGTYAESSQRPDEDWQDFVANAHLWLAYAADVPVGSVGMWASPDLPPGSVYLVGMWVAPAARRQGVGAALVRAVMQAARDAGHTRLVLDVADENVDAVSLYDQLGFEPTGAGGVLPSDTSITEHERATPL